MMPALKSSLITLVVPEPSFHVGKKEHSRRVYRLPEYYQKLNNIDQVKGRYFEVGQNVADLGKGSKVGPQILRYCVIQYTTSVQSITRYIRRRI